VTSAGNFADNNTPNDVGASAVTLTIAAPPT
jgi:hypothetical protein